jgi:hypothetical protein
MGSFIFSSDPNFVIAAIILRGEEDGLPIIAALDHMQGLIGQKVAANAGHGGSPAFPAAGRDRPEQTRNFPLRLSSKLKAIPVHSDPFRAPLMTRPGSPGEFHFFISR